MANSVDYKINNWKMDDENDDRNNNSVPSSVNSEGPPIRKIFVGNLGEWTSDCDLQRLFSRYGTVVGVRVPRDIFTHAKKGFGFVTFKYPEDASRVLKLKHGELRLHLRNLCVAPADSWHQLVELPDGTDLWRSNSHRGLKRHHHDSALKLHSSKRQSCNEASTSSESGCAEGDDMEIGAVGGPSLASQTSISVRGEQKQKGESENDEVRVDKGECKIDILNNDCFMHIFWFLNNRERIKIERVCKRWQMVCLDMWVYQKHLDFASDFPLPSRAVLNNRILGTFLKRCGKNLHSLDLSHRPNKLKASVLQIVDCHFDSWDTVPVTEVGFTCLAALPNLVRLDISYSAKVSDAALEAVASRGKLRKLVCRGCRSLTDEGCISVVTSCNELEHFDFSGCDLVTKATVQAALDSVKLRTSNIKLRLVVGATGVRIPDTFEKNPLLEVNFSDSSYIHIHGIPLSEGED